MKLIFRNVIVEKPMQRRPL